MAKNPPAMQETDAGDSGSISGSGRSSGGGHSNPPVFLPGESHGQRSLTAHSRWGSKESDTTGRPSTCARTMGSKTIAREGVGRLPWGILSSQPVYVFIHRGTYLH